MVPSPPTAKPKPAVTAPVPTRPKPAPPPAATAPNVPAKSPARAAQTRRNPGAATSADELAASVAKGGGAEGHAGSDGAPGSSSAAGEAADWYKGMLYERFHAQWEQPTSVFESARKYAATLRIRIETDGRISSYRLVKSSGLVPMDESVLTAAARVGKIDPPPAALVRGGVAEVNIGFVRD